MEWMDWWIMRHWAVFRASNALVHFLQEFLRAHLALVDIIQDEPDGPDSFCAAIDADASDKYSVSGGSLEVAIEFLHNLGPRLDRWVGEGLPSMALDIGERCAVFSDSSFCNKFPAYVLQKEIPALLSWKQPRLPLIGDGIEGCSCKALGGCGGGGRVGSLAGDGGEVGILCLSGEGEDEEDDILLLVLEVFLRASTFLLAGGILYKP
ncbi:OLC1v1036277C1 [Oldenlandia corymbosa var. corymbosa]|uniref:OLC1v1036277C1 n=1 Tax=Oldenlandia corymbosa var. corymbosa TaxID=529605 RepID=A0AAV1CVS0_OLDCO|nr:OLC1v1036277C1 [Oldenlandia corymbosa var. corymbosa]